jgi:Zn-finger nucleic acid-binding protein
MNIETLNCPNCGAGVASDHTECEFCRTRLKTVVCPKCFGLMFFGNRFCGHCGAEAVDAVSSDSSNLGVCPRCKTALDGLDIGAISLSECTRCGGLWSDVMTFEKICSDREQQSAALTFLGNRPAQTAKPSPVQYVPCPQCDKLMNRSNFARSSGVIVDLCKQHGIWMDAGELPKIIDFINSGGLSRAREKEKIALEEEREKIRDERRQLEMYEMRSGNQPPRTSGFETSAGGLIKALFDL